MTDPDHSFNPVKAEMVQLTDRLPGKGPCLTLWSNDVEMIEIFKGLCFTNLPKALNWFHQANSRTYQMFEFWTPERAAIEKCGQAIANAMGLPFDNTLVRAYTRPNPVVIGDFIPFDPDMHTFGDFLE